jgi:hypothetical protein
MSDLSYDKLKTRQMEIANRASMEIQESKMVGLQVPMELQESASLSGTGKVYSEGFQNVDLLVRICEFGTAGLEMLF